ncbi:MAG: Appr-1-p processing protein [Cyanobacteria bacterium SIG30]|nr:Appr-1-p processing protein [Cyanobacteria bacterium SIG30]
MIKYFEGTVFNTNADAIVNTVNCDGFMGAGLALEFALRYPKMFEDYKLKCLSSEIKTGFVSYFNNEDVTIINFPTKDSFKFPSHIKWVEKGLQNFVETYKIHNFKSVAFPKLGCSNGGLDWDVVKNVMEKYLSDLSIDIYICLDIKDYAEGIEKTMLDNFNGSSDDELLNVLKLNKNQIMSLNEKKPYKRFWQISKTANIGSSTYKKIFEYYYKNQGTQMRLF